jgi:hypothetical protein
VETDKTGTATIGPQERPLVAAPSIELDPLYARITAMEASIAALSRDLEARASREQVPSAQPEETKAIDARGEDLERAMRRDLDKGHVDHSYGLEVGDVLRRSLRDTDKGDLEEMECTLRLCRATIAPRAEQALDPSTLYGLPPFSESAGGSVTKGADGKLRIYFARPGEDINRLKDSARGDD